MRRPVEAASKDCDAISLWTSKGYMRSNRLLRYETYTSVRDKDDLDELLGLSCEEMKPILGLKPAREVESLLFF